MRRRFFNIYQSPVLGPLFEQIWIPIPQACSTPSMVEIG